MMRTINTLLTLTNVIRFSSHEARQKNLIDFGSIFSYNIIAILTFHQTVS